jgi:hypothetical protein
MEGRPYIWIVVSIKMTILSGPGEAVDSNETTRTLSALKG